MPTVLRLDGFRFFFYSNERNEPAHIHITKAGSEAKFWLEPISLASNDGFNAATLNKLTSLVRANQAFVLEAWSAYFHPSARDAMLGEETI